jgi:hypothetical protein
MEQLEAANTGINSQNLYVKKSRFVFGGIILVV